MAFMFIRIPLFFVFLNIGMRFMGKRQVGELQLAEFISAIMLSELALLPITDPNIPIIYGLLGIAVLCCLEVITAYLCRRSATVRRAVEGRPLVLLARGKIEEENLNRCRISTEELFAAIRCAGFRGPEEISYIILEQNGKLSVLPKDTAMPPIAPDLNVNVENKGICHPIIIDGHLQQRTLGHTGKDERWLESKLKALGLKAEELLYLCVDDTGEISYERKAK